MFATPAQRNRSVGSRSLHHAELVDVYPTLALLANISVPPTCATSEESASVASCVEGRSLQEFVLADLSTGINNKSVGSGASFWQWSKMMIEKLPIMGYSIATEVGEKPFPYTVWVGYDFKRFKTNFSDNHGEELYNLVSDVDEAFNLAGQLGVAKIQKVLHAKLISGWRNA